ncbi:unnamed protein product [Dicrocoelium dendriticum]|nr:unnamed protein product [Dicrocoelium dendriticum]
MICNRCSSRVAESPNYGIRKCCQTRGETRSEKALKANLRTPKFQKPCITTSISACKHGHNLSNNIKIMDTDYAPETRHINVLSYNSSSSPVANQIKHIPSCPIHMTFPTHLVYASQNYLSFASPAKEKISASTDYTNIVANVPQE